MTVQYSLFNSYSDRNYKTILLLQCFFKENSTYSYLFRHFCANILILFYIINIIINKPIITSPINGKYDFSSTGNYQNNYNVIWIFTKRLLNTD
jgi:hypothetical protein